MVTGVHASERERRLNPRGAGRAQEAGDAGRKSSRGSGMTARTFTAAVWAIGAALFAPLPGRAQGILEQMQDEVASIVSRARPSIVSIEDERIFTGQRGRPNEPDGTRVEAGKPPDAGKGENERPQPGPPLGRRPMGEPPKVGSGFSFGDGFIVTTADVLSGMKNPMVMTEDGRRFRATVSGIDPEMNIGLLKLSSKTTLPGLRLGQSSKLYPGHFAISIGNQFGHINSVALTLVAGIRDDGVPADGHFYPGLIQISGTVGVGTSGAPILNARGEVVGTVRNDTSAENSAPEIVARGEVVRDLVANATDSERFTDAVEGTTVANATPEIVADQTVANDLQSAENSAGTETDSGDFNLIAAENSAPPRRTPAPPIGQFCVILADPPWRYGCGENVHNCGGFAISRVPRSRINEARIRRRARRRLARSDPRTVGRALRQALGTIGACHAANSCQWISFAYTVAYMNQHEAEVQPTQTIQNLP